MEDLPEPQNFKIRTLDDELILAARKYDLFIGRRTSGELTSNSDFAIVWDWNGTTYLIRVFSSLQQAKFFLVDMNRALNSMFNEFGQDWQIVNPEAYENAVREAERFALLRWKYNPRKGRQSLDKLEEGGEKS